MPRRGPARHPSPVRTAGFEQARAAARIDAIRQDAALLSKVRIAARERANRD